jgi:hypothetical protein
MRDYQPFRTAQVRWSRFAPDQVEQHHAGQPNHGPSQHTQPHPNHILGPAASAGWQSTSSHLRHRHQVPRGSNDLLRGSLTWDQGACSRCQCSPSRGLSAVGLGRGAACCPHAIPGKGGPMAASTAHDCLAPTPGMHTAQFAWACGIRYTFTLPVDVRDTRTSCSTPCCTVVCATHER